MITPTSFEAIFPDYDETWDSSHTVIASSHKEAAETAAERFCNHNAEWPGMLTVHVKTAGGTMIVRFDVAVEQVAVFTARTVIEGARQ